MRSYCSGWDGFFGFGIMRGKLGGMHPNWGEGVQGLGGGFCIGGTERRSRMGSRICVGGRGRNNFRDDVTEREECAFRVV